MPTQLMRALVRIHKGLATDGSTQSANFEEPRPETPVATGSMDTSSVDTGADSDNPMSSLDEPALNGTGPSSSQGGTTGTVGQLADLGISVEFNRQITELLLQMKL